MHLSLFDSVTVYYFAKVEDDCKISPLFPEAYTPAKVVFQKGSGQKFQQESGKGFDLGFFEMDDLAKPSPTEDVYPLVIAAETSVPTDGQIDEHMPVKSPHMQITQAVLIKKDSGFQVKVMKQILWIDDVRYELRDLFGIGTSSIAEGSNDESDTGKECVICLTEPKDTAVLPCRHLVSSSIKFILLSDYAYHFEWDGLVNEIYLFSRPIITIEKDFQLSLAITWHVVCHSLHLAIIT